MLKRLNTLLMPEGMDSFLSDCCESIHFSTSLTEVEAQLMCVTVNILATKQHPAVVKRERQYLSCCCFRMFASLPKTESSHTRAYTYKVQIQHTSALFICCVSVPNGKAHFCKFMPGCRHTDKTVTLSYCLPLEVPGDL